MSRPEERFAAIMRGLQEAFCAGLAKVETAPFSSDHWARQGGGGGLTRIVQGGSLFEKGGVNFSEVFGSLSEEFAQEIPGSGLEFYATGVSLVLHPKNPHVPAVHANFRYIEHGDESWLGGGADLTPCYLYAEDTKHFHAVLKEACERHGQDHAKYRDACDEYFFLPHRGERRGVGGIFFEYIDAGRKNAAFVEDAGRSFLRAYLPIVERRRNTRWTDAQRKWQEFCRGRYVEFNLLYDRGTVFGLKTGGRTESILMSLPPRVRWGYCEEPAPGTPEAALLEELRR